jgi:hypothetical protein
MIQKDDGKPLGHTCKQFIQTLPMNPCKNYGTYILSSYQYKSICHDRELISKQPYPMFYKIRIGTLYSSNMLMVSIDAENSQRSMELAYGRTDILPYNWLDVLVYSIAYQKNNIRL